ncbi:MAG: DNA polymerase domain-containing protein, partial [Rhodothermia bacterium]
MSRTSQLTQVGKRKLELSNLSKVLFPEDGIVKAQVVEYYLKIAPTILRHIKGRALSLVRYPDGIHGETFFQKQRPEWAPEWIEYVTLGDEKKSIDYIIASEPASLVWLANLACLELHQVHAHAPNFGQPDYFVFDLDPPEGFDFRIVVETALELKEHV